MAAETRIIPFRHLSCDPALTAGLESNQWLFPIHSCDLQTRVRSCMQQACIDWESSPLGCKFDREALVISVPFESATQYPGLLSMKVALRFFNESPPASTHPAQRATDLELPDSICFSLSLTSIPSVPLNPALLETRESVTEAYAKLFTPVGDSFRILREVRSELTQKVEDRIAEEQAMIQEKEDLEVAVLARRWERDKLELENRWAEKTIEVQRRFNDSLKSVVAQNQADQAAEVVSKFTAECTELQTGLQSTQLELEQRHVQKVEALKTQQNAARESFQQQHAKQREALAQSIGLQPTLHAPTVAEFQQVVEAATTPDAIRNLFFSSRSALLKDRVDLNAYHQKFSLLGAYDMTWTQAEQQDRHILSRAPHLAPHLLREEFSKIDQIPTLGQLFATKVSELEAQARAKQAQRGHVAATASASPVSPGSDPTVVVTAAASDS